MILHFVSPYMNLPNHVSWARVQKENENICCAEGKMAMVGMLMMDFSCSIVKEINGLKHRI